MGEKTGIQWTDRTWNPWQGCARVSPGCDNCYMFRDMRRFGKNPDVVVRSSAQTFNAPLRWEREASAQYGELGKRIARNEQPGADVLAAACTPRSLVFVCSWSDFFIREADTWRDDAWAIMRRCPSLVFQVLTKRHARIERNLPIDWCKGEGPTEHRDGYPNVALGITAEDQDWAERRWEALSEACARWKFISHEPALGPISLGKLYDREGVLPDWVITGGESNPGARPYDFDWARRLIAEGREYGVPIFVKQAGDVAHDRLVPLRINTRHGGDPTEWPLDTYVRQFPAEWGR